MEILAFITIVIVVSGGLASGELFLLQHLEARKVQVGFIPERWTPPEQGMKSSLHERIDDKFQQLQQILAILTLHPDVEALLAQALSRRSKLVRWRQFLIALWGNVFSIIVGWLLSGLVSPITVLNHLHF